MKESGTVYYLDEYGTEYEVQWTAIAQDKIDITTVTRQPVPWGESYSADGASPLERGGYVDNFIAYRRGIISTVRQTIRVNAAGYEITSQAEEQHIDYFAAKRLRPTRFKHYLNKQYTDSELAGVSEGSCFGDIEEDYDMGYFTDPDLASPSNPLTYIDVW